MAQVSSAHSDPTIDCSTSPGLPSVSSGDSSDVGAHALESAANFLPTEVSSAVLGTQQAFSSPGEPAGGAPAEVPHGGGERKHSCLSPAEFHVCAEVKEGAKGWNEETDSFFCFWLLHL